LWAIDRSATYNGSLSIYRKNQKINEKKNFNTNIDQHVNNGKIPKVVRWVAYQ